MVTVFEYINCKILSILIFIVYHLLILCKSCFGQFFCKYKGVFYFRIYFLCLFTVVFLFSVFSFINNMISSKNMSIRPSKTEDNVAIKITGC